MRKFLLKIKNRSHLLFVLFHILNIFLSKYVFFKSHNKFIYNTKMRYNVKRFVQGKNNIIKLGTNTLILNSEFRIIGNNNQIIIGNNCQIGDKCSFWCEGNNCSIIIDDDCTFTLNVHLFSQEDYQSIKIGKDCMLSNNIIIRTSDSHPIYNDYNKRVNMARSIFIGEHVWICPHSTIMKGVNIGKGCIIGSNSIVTKNIDKESLALGMPARVLKRVRWERNI